MSWALMATLSRTATRADGRKMQIAIMSVSAFHWHLVAVEGADQEHQDAEGAMAALLEDHAHAQLPAQGTLPDAIALAERYVKWWQGSRALPFEDCACEPIGKTASASRARRRA